MCSVGRRATPETRSAQIGVANSFLLAGQVAGPLAVAGALIMMAAPTVILLLAARAGTTMSRRRRELARSRWPQPRTGSAWQVAVGGERVVDPDGRGRN